jgi:hypothetical protein
MDSPLASTDALSPFAKPTTATERERSVRGHQRPCFLAAAREREEETWPVMTLFMFPLPSQISLP